MNIGVEAREGSTFCERHVRLARKRLLTTAGFTNVSYLPRETVEPSVVCGVGASHGQMITVQGRTLREDGSNLVVYPVCERVARDKGEGLRIDLEYNSIDVIREPNEPTGLPYTMQQFGGLVFDWCF
jgi:hypothetical protein